MARDTPTNPITRFICKSNGTGNPEDSRRKPGTVLYNIPTTHPILAACSPSAPDFGYSPPRRLRDSFACTRLWPQETTQIIAHIRTNAHRQRSRAIAMATPKRALLSRGRTFLSLASRAST